MSDCGIRPGIRGFSRSGGRRRRVNGRCAYWTPAPSGSTRRSAASSRAVRRRQARRRTAASVRPRRQAISSSRRPPSSASSASAKRTAMSSLGIQRRSMGGSLLLAGVGCRQAARVGRARVAGRHQRARRRRPAHRRPPRQDQPRRRDGRRYATSRATSPGSWRSATCTSPSRQGQRQRRQLPRSASSRSWPIGPARLRLHAALHVRPVGYSRSGEAVRTAGSRPGGSRTGPDRQVPRSWREGEAELTDRPLWDAEPQRAPAMVLALERVGWSNAAFWMRRQAQYDLAQERLRQEQAVA